MVPNPVAVATTSQYQLPPFLHFRQTPRVKTKECDMKTTRLFQIGALSIIPLLASCLGHPEGFTPSPTNVTVVPGDSTVAVSWKVDDDQDLTSLNFSVKYQLTVESPDSCNAVNTKGSCKLACDLNPAYTCQVTGLTNGTSYIFIVTAVSTSVNPDRGGTSSVRSAPAIPMAGK